MNQEGQHKLMRLSRAMTDRAGEYRQQLLDFLQETNVRETISSAVNRDLVSNVFTLAARKNCMDIVGAFADNGINMNIENTDGFTALFLASYSGHEEMVHLLLERNASVDYRLNSTGWTALMQAVTVGHRNVAELLLKENANVDLQSNEGSTALMYACEDGDYIDVVRLLLTNHADIDLTNNEGKTALDLAESEEIKEVLRNHVSNSYVLK